MRNQIKVVINNNKYIGENKCETFSSELIITFPDNTEERHILYADSNTDNITDRLIAFLTGKTDTCDKAEPYTYLEKSATEIISSFGIPAHTRGYRYLRDAVVLVSKNPELLGCVTKGIYPAVAKQNETTPVRVERAIRHAIESCLVRGNAETVYTYFPHCLTNEKGKPTNSEFIAVLSNKLRMQ